MTSRPGSYRIAKTRIGMRPQPTGERQGGGRERIVSSWRTETVSVLKCGWNQSWGKRMSCCEWIRAVMSRKRHPSPHIYLDPVKMSNTLSLLHCDSLAQYSDTDSFPFCRRARPEYEHVPNRFQLQSTNSLVSRDPTFQLMFALL